MEWFGYNYTIIICLLTIFVHKYYAQPIYYTDVSKCCESLTDCPEYPLTLYSTITTVTTEPLDSNISTD